LRDEFMQDEPGVEGQRDNYRLCDEARDAIAQFAQLGVHEVFAGVPVDGFDLGYLRLRFNGTVWEPLLWAAPWLWRITGNRFLDRADEDYGETEPWSQATLLEVRPATGCRCSSICPSFANAASPPGRHQRRKDWMNKLQGPSGPFTGYR